MEIAPEILEGCRKNDRAAQEELYRSVYPYLMRVALRYVINTFDAEDVLNKSMLKALKKIDTFNGTSENLAGWIKRIVVHESIDFIRSRKSFNEKHVTMATLPDEDSTRNLIEDDPSHILKLIDTLPPQEKAVFNLSIIEGYSHKEISKLLSISVANSKWHLHCARKKMKNWIIEKELTC
ncbi:MAG: RNA polymerase sigma factor [Flavobacteriales bacterium]|nr:RNA polymerase sigma factor [Flavobacteriales bacterium]